jgi:hypothetical protein
MLYYLFITSHFNTDVIIESVAKALETDATNLILIGGGRRCDGMVMLEFIGDRDALAKFKPELSESDPDDAELLKERALARSRLMNEFDLFIKRLDLAFNIDSDAELLTCSSSQLPVPCIVYIVMLPNQVFLFCPT